MKRNYAVAIIVAASLVTAGGSAMAFGGHKKGDDRGQMRFEQLDTNKDGKLSLEEMQAEAQKKAGARAADMFERQDANNDGFLTTDELPKPRRADKMFDRIDADGNGSLSEQEFANAKDNMGRHHKKGGRADTDNN